MEPTPDDWRRLERLREGFLGGEEHGVGRPRSRWRDARDLELYDATFARRIAWKWRAVLEELVTRGWHPPAGELLDWGCGTGVAARELLAGFGAAGVTRLRLFDRSADAAAFAAARVRDERPGLEIALEEQPPRAAPALLVASHVANELSPAQLDELVELARASRAVLWVEPGEHLASRTLCAVRERLRGELCVLAPCTHAAACGALAAERDWCHFFAHPPSEVFQDRAWAQLSQRLGIDLRSLPYSYLLLERREPPPPAEPLARLVGRPRTSKADARFFACDASGLREELAKRRDAPELHRALKSSGDAPCFLRLGNPPALAPAPPLRPGDAV